MRRALSDGRLDGYRAASADDDETLLARCLWNLALGEALYPSLCLVEVALRNALNDCLTQEFGAIWFTDPQVLDQRELDMVKKAEVGLVIRGILSPTPDQVIPELYFAFWVRLFFRRYGTPSAPDPSRTYLWPRLRPLVLPYALGPAAQRGRQLDRYQMIRDLRNRVFHHEPIWRGAVAPAARHRPLVQAHREVLEGLGWISPEALRTLVEIDRFPPVHGAGLAPFRAVVGRL